MFAIIVCYDCGRLLLAKTEQKNRQCPHCGARLTVVRTKRVAIADTAAEASRLIRVLKQKEAQT
jgi:DNA-directed RNA polymerase subunit RPC12/RpoP